MALKVLPDFMPSEKQASVHMMVMMGSPCRDVCFDSLRLFSLEPMMPAWLRVQLASTFRLKSSSRIGHEMVKAHQPSVILITTPPVDEYALEATDILKGSTGVTRTAEHTKKYADACREVGLEIGATMVDLWTTIMARAGWQTGDALPGSKSVPRNLVLRDVLRDGRSTSSGRFSPSLFYCRFTFHPRGI